MWKPSFGNKTLFFNVTSIIILIYCLEKLCFGHTNEVSKTFGNARVKLKSIQLLTKHISF